MKKSNVLSGLFITGGLLISLVTTNQQNVQAKDYSYKVVTVKKDPYAQLYDNNMQEIPRAIGNKSDWRVGKTKQVNGTYYYQIAGNEWVSGSDVKPNFDPATGKLNQRIIGTINSTITAIYDNQGNNTYDDGVNLAYQSQWTVGKVIRNSQGRLFYQVAPNMYVRDDDMSLNVTPNNVKDVPNFGLNGKPTTTVTAPSNSSNASSSSNSSNKPTGYSYNVARVVSGNGAKIYDHNGVATSSSVPANSDWRVLRTFNINGGLFFEIGDNQWLNASDCSTNFMPVASNSSSSSNNGGSSTTNSGSSSNSSSNSKPTNDKPFNTNGKGGAADWYVPIQHQPNSAYEQEFLTEINKQRAAKGLAPLTINSKLTQAATKRIQEESTPYDHGNIPTRPDGSSWWSLLSEVGYNWSYARELNAMLGDDTYNRSMADTPKKVRMGAIGDIATNDLGTFNATGYDQNYLNPQAKEMGAAVCYTNNDGRIYVEIIIGTQSSDD